MSNKTEGLLPMRQLVIGLLTSLLALNVAFSQDKREGKKSETPVAIHPKDLAPVQDARDLATKSGILSPNVSLRSLVQKYNDKMASGSGQLTYVAEDRDPKCH